MAKPREDIMPLSDTERFFGGRGWRGLKRFGSCDGPRGSWTGVGGTFGCTFFELYSCAWSDLCHLHRRHSLPRMENWYVQLHARFPVSTTPPVTPPCPSSPIDWTVFYRGDQSASSLDKPKVISLSSSETLVLPQPRCPGPSFSP